MPYKNQLKKHNPFTARAKLKTNKKNWLLIKAKIKSKTAALKTAKEEIAKLLKLTQEHADGINTRLNFLKQEATSNYLDFSDDHKIELAALINNIQALSQLLNKKLS
jgi:hypothetical protein